MIIRGDIEATAMEEVDQLMAERNEVLDELKKQLALAQNRMKQQADKYRREVEYQVGERVFLKIQPCKFKKLAKRINQKLSLCYFGPYEILEKRGAVAYRLKLPNDSKVHPVFHASLLKKSIATDIEVQPLPSFVAEDWELQVEPEEALVVRQNQQGQLEVLIKW